MTKRKSALPGIGDAVPARASLNKATIQLFLDHLAATCHVQGAAGAAGASPSAFYKHRRSDPVFAEAWRVAVQAGYDRLEEALLAKALADVATYDVDPGAVAIELVDGELVDGEAVDDGAGGGGKGGGGDGAPAEEAAMADGGEDRGGREGGGGRALPKRRGRGGLHTSAGLSGKVTRIDVQLALTLLNRRAAIEARGRERHARRRPTAEEVETALTTKLDALSRRLAAPEQ